MLHNLRWRRYWGGAALVFCLVISAVVLVYPREATTASLSIEVHQPNGTQEPCAVATEPISGERAVVEQACALIEQGKFDEADKLIEESAGPHKDWTLAAQLKELVGQWQKLQKDRESQKETVYKEQMSDMRLLRVVKPKDSNEMIEDLQKLAARWLDQALWMQPNDDEMGSGTGVIATLAAVTRTLEFASDKQKEKLLSEPCVVDAENKAKQDANELESKGKWIDAYLMCYSWLAAWTRTARPIRIKPTSLLKERR